MKTVAIDFDGVLNTYAGWSGEEELHEPRPGVEAFLASMALSYRLVIYSTRPSGKIIDWLTRHGLTRYIESVSVTKPMAHAYLDDRAICFDGDFDKAAAAIRGFRAHWETPPLTIHPDVSPEDR